MVVTGVQVARSCFRISSIAISAFGLHTEAVDFCLILVDNISRGVCGNEAFVWLAARQLKHLATCFAGLCLSVAVPILVTLHRHIPVVQVAAANSQSISHSLGRLTSLNLVASTEFVRVVLGLADVDFGSAIVAISTPCIHAEDNDIVLECVHNNAIACLFRIRGIPTVEHDGGGRGRRCRSRNCDCGSCYGTRGCCSGC
mmetsp:Transcript_3350/g.7861  ORF Transcript_3350/g.7861 Transcript_3350/m.7861 type:complete len:200 (-) Transcript_3350:1287-1886(-)